MIEKSIKTDRGRVYYWISEHWDDSKKTVFFLHGLTADHRMFKHQAVCFSKTYNVIVWDAPAHGKSRPYADFSFQNGVADLKRILEENKTKQVIMVGQSLGGYFAQSFIRSCPEMVTAFIGIDTTPYGEDYYSASDRWWLQQVEWMAGLFPRQMLVKAMARSVSVTEYGRRNMTVMLAPYAKKEMCHLMGVGYAGFLDDNADIHIPCPVLLLLGAHDRTGKVKQYNQAWSKRTGYPLQIIKDAAHNANVDNPSAVNRAIMVFLEQL